MQKTWAFLFLVLVIISSVSAETQEQGKAFNLILDHSQYPSCAVSTCNISIFYPNNSLLLSEITLTQNTGYSNISLTNEQTQTAGPHNYIIINSTLNSYKGEYEITPTGFKSDISTSLIGAVILILLFGIGAVLLFFSNTLAESPTWWFFGWVGLAVGLLIFYYDLLLGMVYLRDIAYSTNTYDNIEFIFYLAAKIQAFIPYTFMVGLMYWWWQKRRNLKRAILDDDGYREDVDK